MREVVVLHRAERMVIKAKRWYRRRNPRAAANFMLRVHEAFEAIAVDPWQCQKVDDDFFFKRVLRFPYLVYFRVHNNSIYVVAVVHGRRAPGQWKRGL